MDIDPRVAAALGFPKTKYMAVERERRWLCREVPRAFVEASETVTDLYVTGTRLRLREARPIGGGAPMLRFTRKVDVDAQTRLITSIYLSEDEFALLKASLTGVWLAKLRHRLRPIAGVVMVVDEFQGALSGLVMAEAEFETNEELAAFLMPDFCLREVTGDARYNGGSLAANGLPDARSAS